MDALALLCTLHADGPATLGRLRSAGCGAIAAVQGLGADELGRILEVPPAAARRFLREARHLAQRLDAVAPGSDEAPAPISSEFRARHAPAAAGPRAGADEPQPSARLEAGVAAERVLLDRVLDTWRAEEQRAPRPAASPRMPDPPARRLSAERPPEGGTREGGPTIARRETGREAIGPLLVPRSLDGLDARVCAALSAAGVRDLEALATADTLELSRASGLAYTRLSRLRFLARRAHGALPTDAARQAAALRAAPSRGEGVGGPFA